MRKGRVLLSQQILQILASTRNDNIWNVLSKQNLNVAESSLGILLKNDHTTKLVNHRMWCFKFIKNSKITWHQIEQIMLSKFKIHCKQHDIFFYNKDYTQLLRSPFITFLNSDAQSIYI